jgi:hypothetical protein
LQKENDVKRKGHLLGRSFRAPLRGGVGYLDTGTSGHESLIRGGEIHIGRDAVLEWGPGLERVHADGLAGDDVVHDELVARPEHEFDVVQRRRGASAARKTLQGFLFAVENCVS